MDMKCVMIVGNGTTQKKHTLATENQTECGEMMIDIKKENEMLERFWAEYGEIMWVDPAEQEEL
jgi:cytochrome c-type biogenesis protein CcmH/NrfF